MNRPVPNSVRPRPDRAPVSTVVEDSLIGRWVEEELADRDEGLNERALCELMRCAGSSRPSRGFAGDIVRRIEAEQRAATCWSPAAIYGLVIGAIVLCGSGMLLIAQLAGLRLAPRPDWIGFLGSVVAALLEAPDRVADWTGRLSASWFGLRDAVAWAYSFELLVAGTLTLVFAATALFVLARLMPTCGELESVG